MILPDELIEEIRQALNTEDSYRWRVGDKLVDYMDELAGHKTSQERRKFHAEFIRTIANQVGCSESTLRDRESLSRFFPKKIRAEYDVLSFHQFRACKSAGENWREYAEWAVNNLPAPVALIRARIRGNGHDAKVWEVRLERLQNSIDLILGDNECPHELFEILNGTLLQLEQWYNTRNP